MVLNFKVTERPMKRDLSVPLGNEIWNEHYSTGYFCKLCQDNILHLPAYSFQ